MHANRGMKTFREMIELLEGLNGQAAELACQFDYHLRMAASADIHDRAIVRELAQLSDLGRELFDAAAQLESALDRANRAADRFAHDAQEGDG